MTPGLYRLSAPEGALAPTGIVRVILDDRGFPTIWIDEQKRWPIHMLPEGSVLEEISADGGSAVVVPIDTDPQKKAEDSQGRENHREHSADKKEERDHGRNIA